MNHLSRATVWSLSIMVGGLASAADRPQRDQQAFAGLNGDLGFDRMLVVQRHSVESSHPYTFF